MENSKNVAIMALSVAVVALGGLSAFGAMTPTNTATVEQSGLTGHLEIVHSDGEGNILSYQQMDNTILNTGKEAILDDVFGMNVGNNLEDSDFRYIALGGSNSTTPAEAASSETFASQEIANCSREDAHDGAGAGNTMVVTNSSGNLRLDISARVLGADDADCQTTIGTAALVNHVTNTIGKDASEADVFAYTPFSSDVTLGSSDQLDITWQITFD